MLHNLSPRQQDILAIARKEGRVNVDHLATHFAVTPQTIRKDLNVLCDSSHLQRVHGGAMFPTSTVNLGYHARREISFEAKRRIGETIAKMIPDGASLIMNIGTTVEQVALALRQHQNLLVITNNLNVALILQECSGIDVIVAGGMVRKSDAGIVGASAIDLIQQFRVDYAVIGSSGIDEDGTLLDFDYREVRVAKAILGQARTRILACDASKFGRRPPVQIADVTEIDVVVTDEPPGAAFVEMCKSSDTELVLAEVDATFSPLKDAE